MDFSQTTISEFQDILIECFEKECNEQDATRILSQLVDLYDEIVRLNYKGSG